MNANELRIGNYVRSLVSARGIFIPFAEVKILTLGFDTVETCLIGQIPAQIEEWTKHEYRNIDPIPLTDRWMDIFKANKNEVGTTGEAGHVIYYELDKLTICDWGYGLIMSNAFAHGIRVPLKYVHQLQNLYFALTGEELTVANQVKSQLPTKSESEPR